MSASQEEQREAASALHRNAAGARSHASHTHTRSCLEATRLAAWTRASQDEQRYAESAWQYSTHGADRHVSQTCDQVPVLPPTLLVPSFNMLCLKILYE